MAVLGELEVCAGFFQPRGIQCAVASFARRASRGDSFTNIRLFSLVFKDGFLNHGLA
jgi:hypothetical protein